MNLLIVNNPIASFKFITFPHEIKLENKHVVGKSTLFCCCVYIHIFYKLKQNSVDLFQFNPDINFPINSFKHCTHVFLRVC